MANASPCLRRVWQPSRQGQPLNPGAVGEGQSRGSPRPPGPNSTAWHCFVGRNSELATLAGALADVRAGVPRVVLVDGAAGMGKTALVRRFLSEAEVGLITATGDEGESLLPYGVVAQLLATGEVPHGLDGITSRVPVPDPLAVGTLLVNLLGDLQARGPLVLTVDDVQWADNVSVHALAFAPSACRPTR